MLADREDKSSSSPDAFSGAEDHEFLPAIENDNDARFERGRTEHPNVFDDGKLSLIKIRRRVPGKDHVIQAGGPGCPNERDANNSQQLRELSTVLTLEYIWR
jgi:hypothetical protein